MGIHLGEVERRGVGILGDAVNIASRVEPLAEPGSICLTEPVYVQVRARISCRLERVGPKGLRGVRGPIALYRVDLPWIGKAALLRFGRWTVERDGAPHGCDGKRGGRVGTQRWIPPNPPLYDS